MHKHCFFLLGDLLSGTMDLDPSLREKEAFYAQIDSLESPAKDEDEDLSRDLEFRMQSRAFFANLPRAKRKVNQPIGKPPNLTTQISTPKSLTRATTFPTVISHSTSSTIKATPVAAKDSDQQRRQDQCPSSASFVEDTPFQNPFPSFFSGLKRSATMPGSLSSMLKSAVEQSPSVMSSTNSKAQAARGRPKGKGKTKAEVVVPENKQIFKGLIFYYIPQERISIRRQRMESAEKFGAIVTDKLLDCTHVIVDKELNYNQIEAFIAPILQKDNPVITVYLWPLDCIKAGRILPIKEKYFVWGMRAARGHTVPSDVGGEHPTTTQASDKSLQLKAPRTDPEKWDYVPPRTPSQSDASPVQRPDKRKADSAILEVSSSQETGHENLVIPSSQVAFYQEVQDTDTERDTREGGPACAGEGDELSHMINRVREEFQDLPRLEGDDAFHAPDGEEDEGDTDDEPKVKKRRKSGGKKTSPRSSENKKNLAEHFVCNRGGTKDQTSRQDNPNARTIAVLQQMLSYYEQTNNHWRLRAYRNAINTLSRTQALITTAEEAEELRYFGKSLAQKLEEIVNTNTLRRLAYVQNDPTSKILVLFLGIYGVGKTTADKWIAKGFRTLEDLIQRADLNPNQRIGIDHYEDLNTRIPRTEVKKIGDFVRAEAYRIDGDVNLLIGGSYRRGADSSGDVDFIITKPGTTSSDDLAPFLEKLVGNLTKTGFLTAELAAHDFGRDDGGSKWHGCCVLPPDANRGGSSNLDRPLWRRIDFLLVPETEYGAALIYFTGNDIFNRSIRLLASKKGMRLNQRGLYKDVLRTTYGRQKVTTGELIEGKEERRIFDILQVQWREPEERWC